MSARQNQAPPEFLALAGHPVRWRLLVELARSDLQVRELTALVGQPQSLVSYHLGRLRAGHLVGMRRSSADGRDTYYRIDLARCGELLASAGAALHPGLRLVRPPLPTGAAPGRQAEVAPGRQAEVAPGRQAEVAAGRQAEVAAGQPAGPATSRVSVLFLCTGNSARSQMAQAICEQLAGGMVTAASAGSRPKPLHPNAVAVMAELGVDISSQQPRHVGGLANQRFDYVVSLCDRVREVCPDFPGHPRMIHWSIPDPAAAGGSDAETYPAFLALAADLRERIGFLLSQISAPAREVG